MLVTTKGSLGCRNFSSSALITRAAWTSADGFFTAKVTRHQPQAVTCGDAQVGVLTDVQEHLHAGLVMLEVLYHGVHFLLLLPEVLEKN